MKHFWQGFQGKTAAAPLQFKRHVIVLFTETPESGSELKTSLRRISSKYPSVKVKVINVKKEPLKVARHRVESFPTVLLLKDGREVERLTKELKSPTLVEQLFRKAHV